MTANRQFNAILFLNIWVYMKDVQRSKETLPLRGESKHLIVCLIW